MSRIAFWLSPKSIDLIRGKMIPQMNYIRPISSRLNHTHPLLRSEDLSTHAGTETETSK